MLKILDKMMNNENDKWLELKLKSPPEVENDQFTIEVMAEIELYRANKIKTRKTILFSTYILSFVIFALVTPWTWISERIINAKSDVANLVLTGTETQLSFVSFSVWFIISFAVFLIVQEGRQ